jgi:hypothetical protein
MRTKRLLGIARRIRDWRMGRWLLVIPPFAVAVLGHWLLKEVLEPALPILTPSCWVPYDIAAAEAAARLQMAAAIAVVTVAALTAVGVSVMTAVHQLGRWRILVWFTFAAALVVAGGTLMEGNALYQRVVRPVSAETLGAPTIEKVRLNKCEKVQPSTVIGVDRTRIKLMGAVIVLERPRLGLLNAIVFLSNWLAILVGTLIAFAVPTLAPSKRTAREAGAPVDVETAARDLAARNRSLKYLLFATAGFLFAGLVHFKSWSSWPLAYWTTATLKHPPSVVAGKAGYEAVQSAMINAEATLYVLIMFAAFGPMAFWLRHMASNLAARVPDVASGKVKADDWLAARGVALSIGEHAQRLAALLSPFLAAPLIELIKSAA